MRWIICVIFIASRFAVATRNTQTPSGRKRKFVDLETATTTVDPEDFEPVIATASSDLKIRLMLLNFVRQSPRGALTPLLTQIRSELPDLDIDMEGLQFERELLMNGPIVPSWLHRALMRLASPNNGGLTNLSFSMLAREAPRDSSLMSNPKILIRISGLWIEYCVLPSKRARESRYFCVPVRTEELIGEFREAFSLSDNQYRKYVSDYLAYLTEGLENV